jgi:hypothetical protein
LFVEADLRDVVPYAVVLVVPLFVNADAKPHLGPMDEATAEHLTPGTLVSSQPHPPEARQPLC